MIDDLASEPHRGRVSRAWVFYCLTCPATRMIEWDNIKRYLDKETAVEWVRNHGWSHTKQGWKCPVCKGKKR